MKLLTQRLFLFIFINFIIIIKLQAQAPVINSIQGPVVICSPASSIINYSVTASNSPSSYSWTISGPANLVLTNPSASITSINFSLPYSTDTYTLYCYAINGSGISSTTSFVVNVFETPSVTFSGATYFCQGSSTNLSASPTIFQASSTTISYNWSPSTGLSSTNTATVNASPPTSTNYTVLLANGPCTNTNYFSVIVSPLPIIAASAIPSVICEGQTSTIILTGSANSYSLNNSPIGFGATVSPTITSTYAVKGVDSTGCESLPVNLTVQVNPAPILTTILNPTSICIGDTSTLTLLGNLTSYSINNMSSASSVLLSPPLTSSYTVVGTGVNGCQSTPVPLVLAVNPLPSLTATPVRSVICEGESTPILFTGASVSYSLNGNSTPLLTSLSPTTASVYTVTGKDINGCENFTTFGIIVNTCTSLSDFSIQRNALEAYPNPNSGTFNLYSGKNETIVILNELGEAIRTIEITKEQSFEITGLRTGIYFLISSESKRKIIVTN